MINKTDVDKSRESKSEKRVRRFLVFLLFVQSVVTTLPFYHAIVDEEVVTVTAFQLLVQPDGYGQQGDVQRAIMGGLLVLMPIAAFFFALLDTNSRIKYIATGVCSVMSVAVILFGHMFSLGAVITLVINIVTLFMTSQGVQATTARMNTQN